MWIIEEDADNGSIKKPPLSNYYSTRVCKSYSSVALS